MSDIRMRIPALAGLTVNLAGGVCVVFDEDGIGEGDAAVMKAISECYPGGEVLGPAEEAPAAPVAEQKPETPEEETPAEDQAADATADTLEDAPAETPAEDQVEDAPEDTPAEVLDEGAPAEDQLTPEPEAKPKSTRGRGK
jgi:hypothetical protein